MNRYKYKNAKQDNLWEELTKQAHLDETLDSSLNIKDIMDTWTLQKGYPVVYLDTKYSTDNETIISIKQNWFLLNNLNKTNETNKYKWYIPFTYTTSNELNFNFESKPIWLKPNDSLITITINNTDKDQWIIGNIKHSGFYRVNYDESNWNLLIKQLINDHNKIDVINRAQLIDDSFNLGRAGLIDQTLFLKITSYLTNESDPLAFQTAFIGLNYIADMLSSNKLHHRIFQVIHLY